ncbi:CPBP family intramembrane glutamic endopeptidase [aff. Roholtiella sp. LEGE 12411]|uniref:CPBP family intramembrane glutamic endopeptidase n=1 Tax=aff. Roholtiella sp. LEGE 12411 TaxID=1828822 RepID=UPI001880CAAF|nr:CPBP family intramembrane glutamic endopeptidase [aff. Roholtiella sp. LEGE 12411]MBE9035565.1 CPBP family intramembrane metalloprotease [aff. Roholtiella sp. LEGE 12411]
MRIKAIQGKQGIGTEVKDVTYVEAARWGKYQWWRYLLGLTIILFAWMVAANFVSAIVALALGGKEGVAALSRLDYAAFGSVGGFVVVMAGFPVFLAGILIAVSLIHQRHPRTLVTAREKISWTRIGHGFVAGFVPWVLLGGLGQYFLYPNSFSFNSDLKTFVLFVPIALVITAIQTTTEELFFRGYIVQGASLIWSNRVFLAIVSAVIFTLPHATNPESQEGGWIGMFLGYFVGTGLLYAVVSLIDGTTELAIGAHFANNLAYFLLFNWSGSFFTTPALFSISEYHARFYDFTSLVLIPVFLVIVFRVFKRDKASEPVS